MDDVFFIDKVNEHSHAISAFQSVHLILTVFLFFLWGVLLQTYSLVHI